MNKIAATCQCCSQGKDAARGKKKQRCCTVGECCEQLLSMRTLSDVRGCLRNALSQVMREELNARNVASLVKVPKMVEPRDFNRAWDARCRKAGAPRITVHDGRCSCGSLLVELE